MTTPRRILYVDDNKDSSDLIAAMLRYSNLHCEVSSADCAEDALLLKANQDFDLYIIDCSLPEMSGTDLCRHIRKTDSKVPIMFFSGMARPSDRADGIAAGANEYLVKPNDLEVLPDKVKKLLNEYSLNNDYQSTRNKAHKGIY